MNAIHVLPKGRAKYWTEILPGNTFRCVSTGDNVYLKTEDGAAFSLVLGVTLERIDWEGCNFIKVIPKRVTADGCIEFEDDPS